MRSCLKTVDPVSHMSHVSLAHPPALGTCFIAALGMLLQCVKKNLNRGLDPYEDQIAEMVLIWSSFYTKGLIFNVHETLKNKQKPSQKASCCLWVSWDLQGSLFIVILVETCF